LRHRCRRWRKRRRRRHQHRRRWLEEVRAWLLLLCSCLALLLLRVGIGRRCRRRRRRGLHLSRRAREASARSERPAREKSVLEKVRSLLSSPSVTLFFFLFPFCELERGCSFLAPKPHTPFDFKASTPEAVPRPPRSRRSLSSPSKRREGKLSFRDPEGGKEEGKIFPHSLEGTPFFELAFLLLLPLFGSRGTPLLPFSRRRRDPRGRVVFVSTLRVRDLDRREA
jgi:hypothetical protein